MSWRRTDAVLGLMALAAAVAVLLATGSSSTSSRSSLTLGHFNAVHEGSGSNQGEAGEAAAEAYTDRAYPADGVSIDQIQTAIAADNAIQNRNVARLDEHVGLPRSQHAERRPSRHAVLHPADAVVGARDRGRDRPEVPAARSAGSTWPPRAAASGARRTRSGATPLWTEHLRRHPDERDRLDRRRPERPDRQDDLRRHRRGERER